MTVSSATRVSSRYIASSSSGMLQQGSSGPEVLKLQKALAAAGFNPKGLDGKFGPKTEAALKAFQKAARIVVDGKAGPQTWGALKKWGTTPSTPPSTPQSAPTTPTTPAPSSGSAGIPRMLEWAKSMIGSKYAAVNPFRFGEVPWDGQAHQSVNGSNTVYQYPKGTRVFDCSGFVVAAYKQLGVNLAARGIATSGAIHANTTFLQPVSRENLQPGDLITYNASKGVGHVVIYMGNGKCIEAAGGVGVVIRDVKWDRLKSIRRVPLD